MASSDEIAKAFQAVVEALRPLSTTERRQVFEAVEVVEAPPKKRRGRPRRAPQVGDVYDTHATVMVTGVDGQRITVENDTVSVVDADAMTAWTRVRAPKGEPAAPADRRDDSAARAAGGETR